MSGKKATGRPGLNLWQIFVLAQFRLALDIDYDSWNKVGVSSLDFDSLRKQFPNTIFIVIFQRTTQKTIRGGTAPLYDAGINIEVVKADDSFKNNYAVTTKNRYGVTGVQFGIHAQNILNDSTPEEHTPETSVELLNS